jgi:hypothetical protein
MTRKKQPPKSTSPASWQGSAAARRQAAAILEVLAGMKRPAEAATLLGTTLPRYYQLERRALEGLVKACEAAPRGPHPSPDRRLAQLERENGRLQRECDRHQALVRAAERALGIAPPARPKSSAEKHEAPTGKRRPRRPTVRALRAARTLSADAPPEPSPTVPSPAPQEG